MEPIKEPIRIIWRKCRSVCYKEDYSLKVKPSLGQSIEVGANDIKALIEFEAEREIGK